MIGIILSALAITYLVADGIKNYCGCDSKCTKCSELNCPYRYR